jgi:putative phosphoribosyl transferase
LIASTQGIKSVNGYLDRGGAGGDANNKQQGRPEPMMTQFTDRAEAGRFLASKLERFNGDDTVVYALPRGGVSVGAEIAASLGIPMDVTFAGKVCAPWDSSGAKDTTAKCDGAAMRKPVHSPVRPILPAGRVAIVVDDGCASGVKLQTVVKALRWHGAKAVVVAQPVASRSAIKDFADLVDDVICVELADNGDAGKSYIHRSQADGEEVEDVVYRLTSH